MMMAMIDPDDRDERGPATPEGGSAPIVIVQQGRSTWGRELLLLLLLLATTGYIVYQEYRAPWFIDRGGPRPDARVVEARHVAPLSEGSFRLRAEGKSGGPEDRVDPEPGESIAGSIEPDDPRPPVPVVEGTVPVPSPAGEDREADALAGDELPDAAGTGAGPDDGDVRAEASPPESGRSSTAIVWDRDRLDGPPPTPSGRNARGPDVPEARRPVVADVSRPREPDPPTIAQRRHFLQILAVTIRQYGLGAGPSIDGLCRDFPAEVPGEIRQLERRYGPDSLVGNTDLDWTVTRLRRMGAPEPYLLDRISDRMYRTIGVRHGPRDRMEARVFAARKLLEIPLEIPGVARQ